MNRHAPTSPPRSFSEKLSTLGARLTRTLSKEGTLTGDEESIKQDRSLSRGRDIYSSGRGGAGNIRHSASASREARPEGGPDDFSTSRGREPASIQSARNFSTGRGGAGNIRSPSRDVKQPLNPDIAEEERVIKAHVAATQDTPHSSGRGGVGNISRSRSRGPATSSGVTPSYVSPVRSTGRGGAGNIVPNDGYATEARDEEERKNYLHHGGIHSTGRGGAANLTSMPGPSIEHHEHVHSEYESTGRGGAGNIVRDGSASRT